VVSGGIQAASPLGFWWLDPATVYALSLPLIARLGGGGRPVVLALESGIAGSLWCSPRSPSASTSTARTEDD
jgi:hypothetical protein